MFLTLNYIFPNTTQVTNVPHDDNNPIPQATMFTLKQSEAHKVTDPWSSKPVGNSNEISPPTSKWTRLLRAQTSTPSHHRSLETIALGKRSVDNSRSPPIGKWTYLRRAQTSTPSHHKSLGTIALGKRSVDDSKSPMEVINKRLQVSMEKDQQSQILAESISQPC